MASLGLVRTIAVAGTHVISQIEKFSAARAKIKVIQPTLQAFARLRQFERLYQFQRIPCHYSAFGHYPLPTQ